MMAAIGGVGGLGSLMSGLGNMFGSNPADAGMKYLDQIAPMLKQYMNPYIQAGQSQLPGLESEYGQMTNDPAALLKKFGAGFQEDPGYRWNVNEGTRAINASNAAGGMGGTPQAGQQAATLASHLADQNYQNYLSQALGLHTQGLEGKQGLYDTGFKGATSLSDNLANVLGTQAGMAYRGAESGNQAMGGMFGSLGQFLGGLDKNKGFGKFLSNIF
jgi:hypothetical protein